MLPPYHPLCTRVRASLLVLLAVLCGVQVLSAQRLDMKVLGNYRDIEIPFDLENDFIVISVLLNGKMPLRFIVDTGAENTVLLDRTMTDALQVSYRRSFQVRGADVNTELTAHLATGVSLRLADRLLARNRTILVLEENYFNFERITGTNIHGILGGDFLMRFVVEFNFRRQVMTLHDPAKFRIRRKFVEVPTTFIRNRPYLNIQVGVLRDSTTVRRLLMDTGAGLSLLMHTYPQAMGSDLPEQTIPAYIASGLGGTMEGSVGRSRVVNLADRRLSNVITYFQEVDTVEMKFLNQREGILGNRILKRFTVVVDYVSQRVYLRPEGKAYKRKFAYDRSGISVLAGGDNLNKYSVSSVVPGSPADRAGILVRDRLRAINGVPTSLMSLEGIVRKLEGKAGRRIRVRVYRGGRLEDFTFVLEDLI
ncbi:aspartyl protease family protein [Neolewinella sp.]|uniref:aspartyl protease family protein n=1 Tax=Neolewinella sp. TaxID=2993543 RepID=UPI003B5198A1